ncbi:MAG: hypothetical protein QOJ35_3407 [Solirubrobacteraceae bacterium]|jgi:hypothetical protein|nr:hypothetical protein [Solirubrobacteraceae bacterium]
MAPPPIFICYRRTDAGWAGRLEHELMERFGDDAVFRDRTIPAGVNWRAHIEHVLDDCTVMLVMIGPSWTRLAGQDGVARLWEADDVVRQEIERALQRPDVHVIPVLFDAARMPERDELPPGLQPLCELQAVELDDARWAYDAGRLGDRLASFVRERRGAERAAPERLPAAAAAAMVGVAGLAALVAWPLAQMVAPERLDPSDAKIFGSEWTMRTVDRILSYAIERAVLWAVVAALVLAVAYVVLRRGAGVPAGVLVGLATGALAGALGGAVFILLKDAASVSSDVLLNGAGVAVTGAVLAGRFRSLGATERGALRTLGLGGGLVAGALGYLAFGAGAELAFATQAVVLFATLAAAIAAPSLAPAAARAPREGELA